MRTIPECHTYHSGMSYVPFRPTQNMMSHSTGEGFGPRMFSWERSSPSGLIEASTSRSKKKQNDALKHTHGKFRQMEKRRRLSSLNFVNCVYLTIQYSGQNQWKKNNFAAYAHFQRADVNVKTLVSVCRRHGTVPVVDELHERAADGAADP